MVLSAAAFYQYQAHHHQSDHLNGDTGLLGKGLIGGPQHRLQTLHAGHAVGRLVVEHHRQVGDVSVQLQGGQQIRLQLLFPALERKMMR